MSGPVHFYEGAPRPDNETAKILVPGPITVEKIDGKEVDVPSIEEGHYEIYLLPGVHRIDFRYELFWGDPISGMMVTTDDEAFETLFNAGTVYKITYTPPKDAEEAYWLTGSINARLIESETNRKVESHPAGELDEKGITTKLNSESE